MRKLLAGIVIFLSLSVGFPVTAAPTAAITEKPAPERIDQLTRRLEEIRSMDMENLSRTEKRVLRKEVKEIKKEMQLSGGVYISVGALLIIILLLILLV